MVSQTDIDMLPNINVRTSMVDDGMAGENGNIDSSLLNELELLLQEQQNNSYDISEREWDLNIFRSGSAPPTIQGSINATNSLCGTLDFGSISNGNGGLNGTVMSEDEIRSHPAYLSYYYSHDNLNPRLPHPLLSKEEWRMHQRFGNDGGSQFESMWDCRKKGLMDGGESSSLFSVQPALPGQKKVNGNVEPSVLNSGNLAMQASADWRDVETDGLVGLVGSGIGPRRKSFADILQEGLDRSASLSGSVSRPASRNSFGDSVHTAFISDSHSAEFCDVPQSREGSHPGAASLVRVQSHGSMVSRPSPSVVGASISRSDTPEIQVAGRSKTPGLPPVGRITPGNINDKTEPRAISHHSSTMAELSEVVACLSGLSLSEEGLANGFSHEHSQLYPAISIQSNSLSNEPNGVQHHHPDMSTVGKLAVPSVCSDLFGKEGMTLDHRVSQLDVSGQVSFPKRTASYANLYSERNWQGTEGLEGSPFLQQKTKFPAAPGPEKHLVNRKLNSAISNHLDRGCPRNNRSGNRIQLEGHLPAVNSEIVQYLQRAAGYSNLNSFQGNSFGQNFVGASQGLMTSEKAHLEALLAQQQEQFDLRAPVKSHGFNQGYNENPSYELGMQYQGVSLGNSSHAVKFGNSMLQNDRLARFNPMIRSPMGGPNGSWHLDIGMGVESRCVSTLLEEFKNNKTRAFELSDLVGHVVEFSMDQSGSRFIQQKLEAATDEDKMRIFPEIIPHVRTLMTDVFGNYVIQKFFEHGTQSQREELASQLAGHVLPLSLQMYGCRVIQKALEVVDMDRKTKMVAELDGSVIKCVRDQNGNHVIQKCIECVPESKIRFIISAFFGQVVALSTHPYGCRVIQRVLEHCHDPDTQKIIMDEIMQSVCILAQDQYGNYVIQHVIQHGKPQERSAIIRKLAGQIVKMSQQKFASNVVEKSLTYGGPEERQLLVNEILGTTDENEPLQAMMKDQFGNYVVQKVLETCDEQSRELVLSRIKVHLSALKRFTYGKHIVSRVEKLLTAGERRAVTS